MKSSKSGRKHKAHGRLPHAARDARKHAAITPKTQTSSPSESRSQLLEQNMLYNESTFSSLSGGQPTMFRTQPCPVCKTPMGDMPGTRDAICKSCGYKDPCCE